MKTSCKWMIGVITFIILSWVATAAPFAEWLEGRSPSGRVVRIWGEGDEYSATFEAEDGHAVLLDNSDLCYYYALKDPVTGALVRTAIPVGDESTDDKNTIAAIPLHLRDTSQRAAEERARRIAKADEALGLSRRWEELKAQTRAIREAAKNGETLRSPPSRQTLGNIVGLTLLIDFPMTNSVGVVTNTLANAYHPSITKGQLEELLNGENCTLFGNASSVRKYYEDVSCGNMSYTNIVLGWFTAAHPREYYDDPTQDNGPSAKELIGEVLRQIANDSEYTTKYLPILRRVSYSGSYFRALNVWFAGPSAQVWSKGLWAHKWSLDNTNSNYLPVAVDGEGIKYFSTYQITPVTTSPSIGTFCHENGHMICDFPDLYDYDHGNGGPAGSYSLMSNSGGKNPGYVDAYLRTAAGWVEPKELPANPSLLEVTNSRADVWKYTNPFDSKQYYLIENRQRTGRDSNLPGGGILIWRCDETGSNTSLTPQYGFSGAASNRFNAELSLEQADGLYELEQRTHTSDANDLWFSGNSAAGYGGVFSASSSPCAKWRDASNAAILLSNFSTKDETMTFFSGDTGESSVPLFVSALDSSGFQSLTFSVIATAFGKGADALRVYADVTSDNGSTVTTRSDYLGRISELGARNTFAVSGLTVGQSHSVSLRLVQNGGAGASFNAAQGTLHIVSDSSIANAVDAPSIPFWHGEGKYANDWFVTSGTSCSGGTCARSGTRTNSSANESKSVLHAGVVGPGTLTFQWKVSSESDRYDWLEFSYDGASVTNKIGGTGGTWTGVSVHLDAGERVLTWMYRKDSSVDSGEDCGWIDAVRWDPDKTSPPSAPTNLSATKGTLATGIQLTWTAATDARRYAVYRAQSSVVGSAELVGTTTQCEYLDSATTADSTFYYWVRAENEAGNSSFTGPVNGWWPSPLVVTSVSLDYGVVGTSFSWMLSATGGRQSYSWSLAGGATLPGGLSLNSAGRISGTPTAPFSGVVAIKVTDANGTVAQADVVFDIRSATRPVAVASFAVVCDYGRVVLSWEPQSGADRYIIYRSTTQSFSSAGKIATIVGSSFVDDTVVDGVGYFYWIVAENWLGQGPEGTGVAGSSKVSAVTGDIYVHATAGNDANNGESWKKAKRTIQAAVNAATTGTRIIVAPGKYDPIKTENVRMSIESAEGPVATVIDGGGTNRCATLAPSYSGTNTFLVGFTLTNGRAPGTGSVYGGGSYGGTLSRCIISNCVARSENYYAYGGGAYYGYLRNCLVVGNRAESRAGGAYGGGCEYSKLYNCTVAGNRVELAKSLSFSGGAGVYGGYIYNTVVWDNVLVTSEGTFRSPDANTTAYSYNSETSVNPMFVDAVNGDWRLASNSPCLGTGATSYVPTTDTLDLFGNPRTTGGTVDMGAIQGGVAATGVPSHVGGVRARSDREARGVSIRWHGVAWAERYKVYRGNVQSAAQAVEIGETTMTHFIDTDVGAGATYWYRVVPGNGFGGAALGGAVAVAVTVEDDGADFYVDAAVGDDSADGKSWTNAKRSIRAVAPLLDEGDLVLVKPGRYEPIVVDGIRCEIRSVGGSGVTIIDGGGTNRCARLSIGTSIGTTNAVLKGFSIVNGRADESGDNNYGGGVYGGTLKWCVVSNCVVSSMGGYYSYGGGSYYTYAWNSRYLGNSAISGDNSYGGGAYSGTFYNCLFSGNEAVSDSSSSTAYGGAIAYGYTYCSTLVNNAARNTGGGSSQGGGVYDYYHYGSILWNNTATIGPNMATNSYSRLYYGCSQETNAYCGTSCITANPMFVDAANGDWRLAAGSPCLNAGYNYYAYGTEDLQGAARIQGSRVDMGAFEGAWTAGEKPLPPLEVATRILPAAQVGKSYTTTLSAVGGVAPYTWSVAPDGYSESRSANSFSAVGTAKTWQGDDKCWSLALPFAFPFYGSSCSAVWVGSNGTLAFAKEYSPYSASEVGLSQNVMIAVLWRDLNTSSGDIYVQSSADAVTIRWSGIYYNSSAISFSAMLHADGTIRLRYGAGNANGGMIGLSSGNGSDYILSSVSQSGSMANAADIVFAPLRAIPEGLSLSNGGILSGTPMTSGSKPINVIVTDRNGTSAAATLTFVAGSMQTATSTTPVPVPYSWLDNYAASFGAGHDYEALAHTATGKRNGDGSAMYIWQDYVVGTNPTNVNDVFTATIEMDGSRPVIHWTPDLNENGLYRLRSYTIWGKTNLYDTAWHSPTNNASRFFKVTVEVP